jgi:hypothetical protein
VHPDGTVYAAFFGNRDVQGSIRVSDIVVVRDDAGGAGAQPYSDLVDPDDSLPGRRVATGRQVPFEPNSHGSLGQERLGTHLSLAVDPRNSSVVWLAWGDRTGSDVITLHVRRSLDRGQTWSGDLKVLSNAINPALAVNDRGVVGLLYQQVSGSGSSQRWVTRFERTSGTFAGADARTLATVPAKQPSPQFLPYIGDYVHLMAVGDTFYGVFSANNTPDLANFPQGVIYRRQASFSTHTLLAGGAEVPVSIDPFFFRATTSFRLIGPDTVETVPGGSAGASVSIVRDVGFGDAVDFDLVAPPPGITGTFSPDPATGSSTALTLSVAPTVPLGTYHLTVRGSAGGQARTVTFDLLVKTLALRLAEPDAILFPGAPAQQVAVTLLRAPGFAEAVTLSMQGLPSGAGVGHSFSPATTSGNTSTLTVKASRFADPGIFLVTVKAAGATASDTEPFAIEVLDDGLPLARRREER